MKIGAYLGNDSASLYQYENWLGRPIDNVLMFLDHSSWDAFDKSIPWATQLWEPTGRSVIWSVPLTVNGSSLEQAATGAFDDHYREAALGLAAAHSGSDPIYVRVGWEFNLNRSPWAAQGHEQAFINAYHHLVDSFRAVSGDFKFVWDVNVGGSVIDPATAYPGDHDVDVIGADVYYNTTWDSTDPHKAFQGKVDEAYGLQWQQDFAAAHGKPTAISEWGIQDAHAGGYIQDAAKWFSDHDMLYANYWETNAASFSGELRNGQNWSAGEVFRQTFGASSATADLETSAPSETDTLVFRVSADSYHGDPRFIVSVDGKQVGDVQSTHASHAAGQTQDISVTGAFGSGSHDVTVTFINDAWSGSAATDRNLYVHQISFNGEAYAGDLASNAAGYNSYGVANLYSQGSADWHI